MESANLTITDRCQCSAHHICNCPRNDVAETLFVENIKDIAATLADVMEVCGIHRAKAKAAIDVITYAFVHYDEIRHRIDAVPVKHLCKEDLMHLLSTKCLMDRMEAQLSYSIIKRAFKAYYHGTCEGGLRNPILEAQLIHSQECLWVHAAKRTAQIFAGFEGLFFAAQKKYEMRIKCIYKRLYDRLKERTADPLEIPQCGCRNCLKRSVPVTTTAEQRASTVVQHVETLLRKDDLEVPTSDPYSITDGNVAALLPDPCAEFRRSSELAKESPSQVEAHKVGEKSESKLSVNIPQCQQCKCPQLICECDIDQETGNVISAECSQGPYICRWIRVHEFDEVDRDPDKCYELPSSHVCPLDCTEEDSNIICDDECECDCNDNCECESSDFDEPLIEDNDEDGSNVVDSTSEDEDLYNSCRSHLKHLVKHNNTFNSETAANDVVEQKNAKMIRESKQLRRVSAAAAALG